MINRIRQLADRGITQPWKRADAVAFACIVLMLGVGIALSINGQTSRHDFNIFLIPAIVFAAGFGGYVPGIILTVLAVLTHGFIDHTIIGHETKGYAAAIALGATGALLSFGGGLFRQSLITSGRAHSEIQKREADLRAIIETVPDSLIVIDEHGIIVRFSPGAQEQFGWHAEEAIGENVTMLMPTPYRDLHQAHVDRHMRLRNSPVVGRTRLLTGLRKDGSTFPIELSLGELNIDDRHHFVGFIRDLTDRHETEQRMQELQTELFHVSRLSALGQLASAIAHEINQPLSAIANYIAGAKKLAARGTDPEALQQALTLAAREAIRAGETIRKLRAFLSRGETDMRSEDLPALIDEAIAIALTGNNHRKLRLQTRMAPEIKRVIVDKIQIQQVLLNLIRNGMEAMSKSSRRQMIIEAAPAAEDMVVISVIDSGAGLSPEAQEQLFKPFVSSKSTGMGIGLSITRSIVEAHGGRIWTEANPEGGAIFRFTVRAVATTEQGYRKQGTLS